MVSPIKFSNQLIAGEVRIEMKSQVPRVRSAVFEPHSISQKVLNAGQAAVKLTHPVGLLAAEVNTTQGQVSVARLLAHDVVTRAEAGYAQFTRDPHYQPPQSIASWRELYQRLPSHERLLDGGLLIAGAVITKGKKPKVLQQKIEQLEAQLKDHTGLLGTTRNQLSAVKRGNDQVLIEKLEGWVKHLEDEVAKGTKTLENLLKKQKSASKSPATPKNK